jgi:hypothetical protein
VYQEGKENNLNNWNIPLNKIEVFPNDIFFRNIKQYFLDPRRYKKLAQIKYGLTIEKVISDYFRCLHKHSVAKLKEMKPFQKITYFSDFIEEGIRYSLACNQDQQDFMRQCFIKAGIISESDPYSRLTFTTKSEASTYSCLAWDRSQSEIIYSDQYLVRDIGYSSLSVYSILTGTTDSTSTVEFISDYPGLGSLSFNNNFKKYL